MCTNTVDVDDLEDGRQVMTSKSLPSSILYEGGVCKKCQINSEILYQLSFREAECLECFLMYVRHKFRATLGSSKALPKNAQVLLVFDGSAESIMLLDIMHYAISENQFKRLHCAVKVFFLDDSLWHPNISLDFIKIENVKKFINRYGSFDSCFSPLNDETEFLNLEQITEEMCLNNSDKKYNLQNIKTLTSQQDYIYEKKRHILLTAGKELNCQFVFVPDTSVALATRLLTSITLGRGGSTATDVELLDNRGKLIQNVQLIRPMKDINMNEVKLYLHARNLHELNFSIAPYGLELGPHASLQNLTQAFIENLQNSFPATVSTVYRTGNKLAANVNLENSLKSLNVNDEIGLINKCYLCLANLDFHNSNTLLAIEVSRLASEAGNTILDGETFAAEATKNLIKKEDETFSRLCHSCRNIYRDRLSNSQKYEIWEGH